MAPELQTLTEAHLMFADRSRSVTSWRTAALFKLPGPTNLSYMTDISLSVR